MERSSFRIWLGLISKIQLFDEKKIFVHKEKTGTLGKTSMKIELLDPHSCLFGFGHKGPLVLSYLIATHTNESFRSKMYAERDMINILAICMQVRVGQKTRKL